MTRGGFWRALVGGVASTASAKTQLEECPYRVPTLEEIKRDNGYVVNGHIFQWSCIERVIGGWFNVPLKVTQGGLGVWLRDGGSCPFIEMTHRENEDVYPENEFMQDCFRLCVKKMQNLGVKL